MRAALLRYPIIFLEESAEQSDSGSIKKSWNVLLATRCEKLRNTPSAREENAKEEFFENTLRVRLRNRDLINESSHVTFQNQRYRIILKDDSVKEKTTILTLKKDNV